MPADGHVWSEMQGYVCYSCIIAQTSLCRWWEIIKICQLNPNGPHPTEVLPLYFYAHMSALSSLTSNFFPEDLRSQLQDISSRRLEFHNLRFLWSCQTNLSVNLFFSEKRIRKSNGRLIGSARFGPAIGRNVRELTHERGRWQCVYFMAGCIWPSLSYAADGEL